MKTEHMEYFVKAAEACSLNKVAGRNTILLIK